MWPNLDTIINTITIITITIITIVTIVTVMIITSTMIVTVIAITITIMEFSCVSETNKHTALSSLSEVGGIRSGPSALFVVNGKTAHRPEFTETKGYGVVRSEISGKYCFRKGG